MRVPGCESGNQGKEICPNSQSCLPGHRVALQWGQGCPEAEVVGGKGRGVTGTRGSPANTPRLYLENCEISESKD